MLRIVQQSNDDIPDRGSLTQLTLDRALDTVLHSESPRRPEHLVRQGVFSIQYQA